MARMLMNDFINRPNTSANADIAEMLSPTEKRLTERLCLVHIRGKRGRTVPVIVTPDAYKSISLLVKEENRSAAGINSENRFVFALGKNSMNSIRGWDALASTVDKADLEKPSSIKGTLLRQYIATVSQILNMNENEMDWLATHLGHDIRVHRNFYRLRHEHIELAKVAKLLYTVDSGDLHKYAGKKLDDLDINDMTLAEDVDDGNDDAGNNDDDAPNYVSQINVDNAIIESDCDEIVKTSGKTTSKLKPKNNADIGCGKKCIHKPWSVAEKNFVETFFADNIEQQKISGVGKRQCENAIKTSNGILVSRTWLQVKSCVKNIVNKKRK